MLKKIEFTSADFGFRGLIHIDDAVKVANKKVEPINAMIDKAIPLHLDRSGYLHEKTNVCDKNCEFVGYLVEPITKEKPEDVLRDFIKEFHPDEFETDTKAFELIYRAKRALNQAGE